MPITGVGQVATSTEGTGDVRVVYSVTGSNITSLWSAKGGSGSVSFVYNIQGSGVSASSNEGTGSLGVIFSIDGSADIGSKTDGTGFVKHNLSLTGVGEIGKYGLASTSDPNTGDPGFLNAPIAGDVRVVYSVYGSGETPSSTEGSGTVQLGTLNSHGEIGSSTEGTGTVDLIPNLSAIATQASLEQINEELQLRLQDTVSVTFDAVSYDQRADHITLYCMKDIVDNWANYTDLKNGTDIDWGVSDGTILTMTQAEFSTFYTDTLTAWRDRADRIIEKARDWSSTGVALSVIQDDSNWA